MPISTPLMFITFEPIVMLMILAPNAIVTVCVSPFQRTVAAFIVLMMEKYISVVPKRSRWHLSIINIKRIAWMVKSNTSGDLEEIA